MNTQQPDITYIDNYIKEGKQSVLSLRNFYDTILVGDANYLPLCPRCIMKRRGEKDMQYLLG